jgi:hypothetical protein
VIASNQAVRLGLRAASRNPELAFGRALMDQAGSLLALLPALLAALLVLGSLDADLVSFVDVLSALRWPTAGGLLVAAALSFTAGAVFWAGTLPLLAADVELDRRPPPGNFALLASRGFARVLLASLLSELLSALVVAGIVCALLLAVPWLVAGPSSTRFALVALVATAGAAAMLFIDLLARFWLLRAAAFGDGASSAFGKAASLLGARLGQGVVVTVAFFVLEAIATGVAGTLGGIFSGPALFGPDTAVLALAPRLALGLAFAAVFSWLEVGRMGALAAIACDAEGLLGPAEPPPPAPEPIVEAQPVIEALPVDEDGH